MPKELHPGQSAYISVNNDIVGIIGKIHPEINKEAVFVMEINLDKLLESKERHSNSRRQKNNCRRYSNANKKSSRFITNK